MKNKFTKNLGLKILSLFAACILWLVVVNVDDPVINKTYTGIAVEILNKNLIEEQGKCYEVLDGTDTVNVVVTAKRSVIDEMSKDYIKATADFKELSADGTVPIEVKSTRYSDRIDSVSTRTESMKLDLENVVERSVPVTIEYGGEVAEGYVLDTVESGLENIKVSGPESVVETVARVSAQIDISGLDKDTSITQTLHPYDDSGYEITDDRLVLESTVVSVDFTVNGTKEIPISCGYSGNPLSGYTVTGSIITDPSSVTVTGRGENYDDIDVLFIPPDDVSVEGASEDVSLTVDVSGYLPTGVKFADSDFSQQVDVTVSIEPTEKKTISVPLSNITITNLPAGYMANLVDIGGSVDVEIQGLGDTFDRYSGDLAIGTIDASTLVSTTGTAVTAAGVLQVGENQGTVTFDLPIGITLVNPVTLRVIVDYSADLAGEELTDTANTDTSAASMTDSTETTEEQSTEKKSSAEEEKSSGEGENGDDPNASPTEEHLVNNTGVPLIGGNGAESENQNN